MSDEKAALVHEIGKLAAKQILARATAGQLTWPEIAIACETTLVIVAMARSRIRGESDASFRSVGSGDRAREGGEGGGDATAVAENFLDTIIALARARASRALNETGLHSRPLR